ncbi:MAG: putative UDP-N-acetylglucosamine--peptide N-acetylglucosaminyltransferase isoform [Gammaproteobacteria bacterium]|jgi:predicted O-linked N-acetylglucosamine transferase (SPINDLY family)|nr:putative UDP-N-acetylglucosamine--peptide N-acetylglucosaminyltransferase isoform [Gammaproteobacteria bacterium]
MPGNARTEQLFARAVALQQQGEIKAAMGLYQELLREAPHHAAALTNLGAAFESLGRKREAMACFKKACELAPDNANALSNLGASYQQFGQLTEAIACFEKCIAQHPEHAMAYANLAYAYFQYGYLGKALSFCEKALMLEPTNTVAQLNLGLIEVNRGNIQAGLIAFNTVLELEPGDKAASSNIVYASTYSDELSDETVLNLHRQCGDSLSKSITPYNTWQVSRDPNRKLRIGYLSADFHVHPVAYVFTSFLPYHDKSAVDIVAYSNGIKADETTKLIKSQCTEWNDVIRLNDRELAAKIRADQIDLLIDLGGHTAQSRLSVLAYKAAPIQATYIGYPMTTGLSTVDYLIADKEVCPEKYSHLYTEKIAYLPGSIFCFRPHDFAPKIVELPALKKGYLTFGCYNNLPKLTPAVVRLWSQLLKALPTAKLILKSRPFADDSTVKRYQQLFLAEGVELERIDFRGPSVHPEMLSQLNEMDIALDPFPFAGGITTCETLWQGVPLITLAGTRFSQRMGLSFLTNLGLTEWIASTHQDYIAIAKRASEHLNELALLRQALRAKMAASLLCDGKRFAAQLETLYRELWIDWCQTLQQ